MLVNGTQGTINLSSGSIPILWSMGTLDIISHYWHILTNILAKWLPLTIQAGFLDDQLCKLCFVTYNGQLGLAEDVLHPVLQPPGRSENSVLKHRADFMLCSFPNMSTVSLMV